MLSRLMSSLLVVAAAVVFSSATRAIDPPDVTTVQASVGRTSGESAESAWRVLAADAVASRVAAQATSDAGWPAGADPQGPYEAPVVDRVWELPARPGFPGAQGVEGHATHRAPCEAARRDLWIMTFTVRGGATTTVVR